MFHGIRMMDVRRLIALAGDGMLRVEKLAAGDYLIRTRDGRRWHVVQVPTTLTWRATEIK
jgi:hypothetical protein